MVTLTLFVQAQMKPPLLSSSVARDTMETYRLVLDYTESKLMLKD